MHSYSLSFQSQFPDATFGAVLVTTPQAVSVDDVRRQITFCRKTGVNILGVVENMSGFVCPNCDSCANVFSKGVREREEQGCGSGEF